MLFNELRHFSPWTTPMRKGGFLYVKVCLWIFLLVRKQYLPKKNPALLAQNLGGKNCQNSVYSKSKNCQNSGYSKSKKKWHGPLSH